VRRAGARACLRRAGARAHTRRAAALICGCVLLAGCGAASTTVNRRARNGIPPSLLAGARPIGRGPRFQPPLHSEPTGRCTDTLGARQQAHVEVFGANRVVLLPAGIGTRSPRRFSDARIIDAACFAGLVTLDPTGTVYFRAGQRFTLGELFDAWDEPLTPTRIASFGGARVRAYIDGRLHNGNPREITLRSNSEIVLEAGPRVPPHTHFPFPPLPAATLR
jgi:hypothetical protein